MSTFDFDSSSAFDLVGAEVTLDDVVSGKTPLKRGAKGGVVSEIQRLLGFAEADVDADFGPYTESAVRAFQSTHDVKPVNGVVGKDTMEAIYTAKMKGEKLLPPPKALGRSSSAAANVTKKEAELATTKPGTAEVLETVSEMSPTVKYAAGGGLVIGTLAILYLALSSLFSSKASSSGGSS